MSSQSDARQALGALPLPTPRADVAGERLVVLNRNVRIGGEDTEVVGCITARESAVAPVPGERDLVDHALVHS
jgi:hypothetical protein